MIKLQTVVEAGECPEKISYNDKILVMGSCFADNIGKKLQAAAYDVCLNPFGTLYNPLSLRSAFQRLSICHEFEEKDCVAMGAGAGLYCSFSHHTSFADPTVSGFMARANSALISSSDFYRKASKVILTLGTAWCYRLRTSGETVSNCLKRPASEFERYRLDVLEVVDALVDIIEEAPDKKFYLTLSPIRHLKDTAHGNQLSKSILLIAIEMVCLKYPDRVFYFPSYEIVMDELRDYRFYAADMVHPSDLTVDYLWERFQEFALDKGEKEKLLANEKLYRQSQHRKMH